MNRTGVFPWRMAILFAIFLSLYCWSDSHPSWHIIAPIFGVLALGYGLATAWGLRYLLGYVPLIWTLKKPSGLYGRSYKPTVKDAVRFGLTLDNKSGNGFPIAALNGKRLFYQGNSHVTCVASNGAGKSASVSIPMGLSIGAHKSLVFTGKGSELADIVGAYRRDVLGQQVYINDVWGISTAQHYCLNVIGDLHGFVATEDTEALDIADKRKLLLIPETDGDENFFNDFAGPILADAMVFSVWHELEYGELSGNLPWLCTKFNGSQQELEAFLSEMASCEIYAGRIKRSGNRMLAMLKQSPKTAMGVIGVITNALAMFDPAMRLGQNIQSSDFDIAKLKREPISIGICIPPDKITSHGTYAGLVVDMLITASLRANAFEPQVTFLLDEFGNLSKGEIPSINTAQYLGRSLGTQLVTFVQDTSIFERYREPSAFVTQSEVYMAWSVRDTDDAEELSKRSGNCSVMVENTNLQQQAGGEPGADYSVGLSEKSVPLYRPDEFLQMPDYKAAVFFKQNPPIMADLVHYQSVDAWRDYAASNPAIPMDGVPVTYRLNS